MEHTRHLPLPWRLNRTMVDWPGIATWMLGLILVLYLALQDGGYDAIVREEVGIAVWWIALCTVASGALPLPLKSRAAVAALALFGGFVVWTGLSLIWTESSERTVTELARVVTYLGFLVLALAVAAGRDRARGLLNGITCAVGVIALLAVLSRLHPQWFPENTLNSFLPGIEIERRLAYPLNYASAVGVLSAIAIPLLVGATAWARTLTGQALAAAAIPLAGFMLVLAGSGVGTAAAIVGVAAFVVLSPDRLPKLATLGLGAAGTGILAAGLADRPALDRGLPTPELIAQGNELLVVAIAVCAGVALLQTAVGLAVRFGERPWWLMITRREALLASAVAIVIAIPAGVIAGVPGELSDGWENFKQRGTTADQTDRGAVLVDTSSSGRYEFWESAARAGGEEPLTGFGPGTFEYYWSQDPEGYAFVRDAHSLYMESLAELGFVGLVLIVAFVLATLGIGVWRSLRVGPEARVRIAAATAASAAFGMGAALDWIWEIAALPALLMLLIAVIALDSDRDEVDGITAPRDPLEPRLSRFRTWAPRAGGGLLAIAALLIIWFPLKGAGDLLDSQINVAGGDLPAALEEADAAADAQPYAASPLLQKAIVLELQGDLEGAVLAARAATEKEPVNWRNWITRSRLEARNGNAEAAVRALRRARQLNPRSAAGRA